MQPPSLLEDVSFILLFFSLFTVLMTLVPYIYRLTGIEKNDDGLILLLWFSLFLIFSALFKYIENLRNNEEDEIL